MSKKVKIAILNIVIIISFVLFGNIGSVLSANPPLASSQFNSGLSQTGAGAGYTQALMKATPSTIVATVIKTVLAFVGVLLLILLVYGGFKWLKSSGRDDEVAKAKKIIENAIIGIIVVIAAYAITAYIGSLFGDFVKS